MRQISGSLSILALGALTLTGCAGATIQPGHRALYFDPRSGGIQHEVLQPGWYRTACAFWEPGNKCPRVDDFDVTYSTSKEDVHTLSAEGLPARSPHRRRLPANRGRALHARHRDRAQLLRRSRRPRVQERGDRRLRAHVVPGPAEEERRDRGRDRARAPRTPQRQARRGLERPHSEGHLRARDHAIAAGAGRLAGGDPPQQAAPREPGGAAEARARAHRPDQEARARDDVRAEEDGARGADRAAKDGAPGEGRAGEAHGYDRDRGEEDPVRVSRPKRRRRASSRPSATSRRSGGLRPSRGRSTG